MRNIISTSYISLGLGNLIVAEELHIPPSVCVGTVWGYEWSLPCTQNLICASRSDWQTTQSTKQTFIWGHSHDPRPGSSSWCKWMSFHDKNTITIFKKTVLIQRPPIGLNRREMTKLEGHSEVTLTCRKNNDTFSAANSVLGEIWRSSCSLKQRYILNSVGKKIQAWSIKG